MNRTLIATARKKLLRRGRALLRSAPSAGTPTALGLAAADLAELQEIHAALERIERGIWGRCEDCPGAIEEAHLELMPWERRCASCRGAQAAEIPAALEPELERASA